MLLYSTRTDHTGGTVRDSVNVNQDRVQQRMDGSRDDRSGTLPNQRHGMKVLIESSEKLQMLNYLRQEISLPVIKELKQFQDIACAAQPKCRLNQWISWQICEHSFKHTYVPIQAYVCSNASPPEGWVLPPPPPMISHRHNRDSRKP